MDDSARLDPSDRFLLPDYQHSRPFASFLPGIAGPLGTPLWAFYVNRGQCIAGFGVESKDSPIMEFQPANKAYQSTPALGFRTFLKLENAQENHFYEPFLQGGETHQRMWTGANELEIEEIHPVLGLKTNVFYTILPGEPFGGLLRRVTIQNLAEALLPLELLDGLPAVIPYGVNNFLLKELGRTVEAWMEVFNHTERVPFYRLRASVIDRVEVETFQAGHFALGLAGDELLPALVDPALVFESDTSLAQPLGFQRRSLETLLSQPQVTCGRTPCAFFAHQAVLAPQEKLTLYSLYGHAGGLEVLRRHLPRITHPIYFINKAREAQDLTGQLTSVVETHTAHPLFDAYCRQSFLDNILRGGWPALLGSPDQPHIYPLYSRKHGDLERDYNNFWIAAEPFSQGETSYRDVNQNRRDTVRLEPGIGDFDIRTFVSLIQTDGYNPRTLKGFSFTISPEKRAAALAGVPHPELLLPLLSQSFTPGNLLRLIGEQALELPLPPLAFLNQVLSQAEQHLEAAFFEGYWIDHWEYNLDLVESYQAVYPDRLDELLFAQADLPFFDSPAFVQPRSRKYVLLNGLPRQVGALLEDREKEALIAGRAEAPNWTRTRGGLGEIYYASLFAKLALTTLLKFATLDPWGMGIEMEASRPGWYDALNGLPALFGSGMAETYELLRWLTFLRGAVRDHGAGEVRLPVEAARLLRDVQSALANFDRSGSEDRDFLYWDAVSGARETYRAATRLGLDGAEEVFSLGTLDTALSAFERKITTGITRAEALNGGLPPTYFTYQVDQYDLLEKFDPQGRPYIRARRFTPQVLPPFLEGPVRAYKTLPNAAAARHLYHQVKEGPLYDRELHMYKVNASLESQPHSIGRARAFPPGWLENESIWLHMEYKYLLELLKAGLYVEFYSDLRHTLVPFLDPEVYGRSLLENSSFIASSAHPDPALHGAGFVARLSGSTAEFLSIWNLMMSGSQPFFTHAGQLHLALRPALPAWLFDAGHRISFRFLNRCTVTYHNPQRLDTFAPGVQPGKITLHLPGGELHTLPGPIITPPYAEQVREGKIDQIEIDF